MQRPAEAEDRKLCGRVVLAEVGDVRQRRRDERQDQRGRGADAQMAAAGAVLLDASAMIFATSRSRSIVSSATSEITRSAAAPAKA